MEDAVTRGLAHLASLALSEADEGPRATKATTTASWVSARLSRDPDLDCVRMAVTAALRTAYERGGRARCLEDAAARPEVESALAGIADDVAAIIGRVAPTSTPSGGVHNKKQKMRQCEDEAEREPTVWGGGASVPFSLGTLSGQSGWFGNGTSDGMEWGYDDDPDQPDRVKLLVTHLQPDSGRAANLKALEDIEEMCSESPDQLQYHKSWPEVREGLFRLTSDGEKIDMEVQMRALSAHWRLYQDMAGAQALDLVDNVARSMALRHANHRYAVSGGSARPGLALVGDSKLSLMIREAKAFICMVHRMPEMLPLVSETKALEVTDRILGLIGSGSSMPLGDGHLAVRHFIALVDPRATWLLTLLRSMPGAELRARLAATGYLDATVAQHSGGLAMGISMPTPPNVHVFRTEPLVAFTTKCRREKVLTVSAIQGASELHAVSVLGYFASYGLIKSDSLGPVLETLSRAIARGGKDHTSPLRRASAVVAASALESLFGRNSARFPECSVNHFVASVEAFVGDCDISTPDIEEYRGLFISVMRCLEALSHADTGLTKPTQERLQRAIEAVTTTTSQKSPSH